MIVQNSIPKEIKGLKNAGAAVVHEFVTEVTLATHKEALRGINRGPATGRTYEKYNPRRTHQASAPGERPAADTGRLASSVEFELPTNKVKPVGIVGTALQYGKFLELKPSTLGGRPWLMPAFNVAADRGEKLLAKVFKRHNKKGGK